MLQNWDKKYYYNQWTVEVDKLNCTHKVSVSECKNVVDYIGRENLVPLMEKFIQILEFSTEVLIEAQNQANNFLNNFNQNIENSPEGSCKLSRNSMKILKKEFQTLFLSE